MPLISANRQLAFATEKEAGTAETLSTSSEFARVLNPQMNINLEEIADEAAAPSAGRLAPSQGLRQATMTFGVEIAGPKGSGEDATNDPFFHSLLLACGFKRVAAKTMTITGFKTGAGDVFKQGREFSGDVSSGQGRVLKTIFKDQGTTDLIYEDLGTDFTSSDTELTLSDTGGDYDGNIVEVSSQTPADLGIAYVPISRPVYTITYSTGIGAGYAVGDILKGGSSKAVARVVEAVSSGGTKCRVEFLSKNGFTASETVTNEDQSDAVAVTATPQAAFAFPSLTLGLVEDRRMKKIHGARGQVQVVATAGRPVRLNFTFSGLYNPVTDQDPFDAAIDGGLTPPRFVSGNHWFGTSSGVCPPFNELQITYNPSPAAVANPKSSEGVEQFYGAQRVISGSIDPLAELETAFGLYNKADDKESFPMFFSWGSTAGNKYEIQMDQVVLGSPNSGDRNGLLTDQTPFGAYLYKDDDELVIIQR